MSTPRIDHFVKARLGKMRPLRTEDLTKITPIWQLGVGDNQDTGILLIHGFSATPASVANLASQVIAQGYTVAAPALAGHASQYYDLQQVTWHDWFNSVKEPLQQLSTHCSKIIVLGQSLGGVLATQLAYQFPEMINQLILLSPAFEAPIRLKLTPILKKILTFFGIKMWPSIGGDLKNKHKSEITYKKMPLNIFVELLNCINHTKTILSDITTPTTIFASRRDHVIPPKGIQQAFNELASTHKELIWLHNSFHVITQDNDAPQVCEYVLQQLSALTKNKSDQNTRTTPRL